jgi:hypothetical protein
MPYVQISVTLAQQIVDILLEEGLTDLRFNKVAEALDETQGAVHNAAGGKATLEVEVIE